MSSYRPVNAVVRALQLLEILNRQKFTTVEMLHQLSGLPKPTIVRFMETLSTAGYVCKDATGKGYRLTSAVTALSCGYQGAPLVVEAARPVAQELTHQLKWPIAIAVLEENAMLVSYSTSGESPMSPYQGILRRRMGLLTKALGRAYLAFCPLDERGLILQILARTSHPDSAVSMSSAEIETMLKEVRREGFAKRGPSGDPKSSSLALPIFELDGERVLGTIGMTYYTSAVDEEEARKRYVPLLETAAKDVSRNVAALQRQAA